MAVCLTLAFLAGSVVLAWQARHYQLTGQPMPNGKGGFMACGDGYMLAAILFWMSIAAFIGSRKLLKSEK